MKKTALLLVSVSALFFATLGRAQSPASLPVVVDNRVGQPTYHQITSVPDFWTHNPVPLSALPTIPWSQTSGTEASLGFPGTSGFVLSSTTNGTRSWVARELSLGNPTADGYLLSSTAGGTRSWVPPPQSMTGPQIETALETATLYPVFIIPLGSGFYDFEIKASVSNFSGNATVYLFSSVTNGVSAGVPTDTSPYFWFTTGALGDSRSWRPGNPATSLYAQVGSNSNVRLNHIVFIPSKLSASPGWMYKGNTHLIWSYVRITPFGPETDGSGHTVFSPIIPTTWQAAPTSP